MNRVEGRRQDDSRNGRKARVDQRRTQRRLKRKEEERKVQKVKYR